MSEYTMRVTLPCGPSDLGAEIEAEITFRYRPGTPFHTYKRNGDPADPPDPPEIEFVSAEPYCNGKPSPFHGAFADLEQEGLDDLVEAWLDGDAGFNAACDFAEDHNGVDPDDERQKRIDDDLMDR